MRSCLSPDNASLEIIEGGFLLLLLLSKGIVSRRASCLLHPVAIILWVSSYSPSMDMATIPAILIGYRVSHTILHLYLGGVECPFACSTLFSTLRRDSSIDR